MQHSNFIASYYDESICQSRNTGNWLGPLIGLLMVSGCVVLMLGVPIFTFVYRTQAEADTYNKMCKPESKATFQDAFFAELRVDGNCARR